MTIRDFPVFSSYLLATRGLAPRASAAAMTAAAVTALLAFAGCSARDSKPTSRRSGLPALVYQSGGLPGVHHAAHPERESAGAPDSARGVAGAPTRCNQANLERQAAQGLAVWLKVDGLGNPTPLPPDRDPYVSPVAVNRYVLSLTHRYPGAGRADRSLRALGHLRIYLRPDRTAEAVGRLQKGSRISLLGFAGRAGCRAGWMALSPYAYVCTTRMRPDRRRPRMEPQPRVPKGRITPGVYGYIRPGGAPSYASRASAKKGRVGRHLPGGFFIRFGRFVRVGDTSYWKTTKGLYVPVDRIARHVPSHFHGFRLDGEHMRLPLAIVRFKGPGKHGIPVYRRPGAQQVIGRMKRYTAVDVLGTLVHRGPKGRRRRYLRVGHCQWIRSRGVRVAHREPPPPGVTANERWIDVDLAQQVLVAYEGTRPVFATLISTGKKGHETRHGVFRIYWKVAEVDMANEAGAEEEYLASAVPWSMFFWKGQALHGAYWHDDFGRVKSHGCVNLSPLDAHFLFDWTRPTLPPGWLHAWHGDHFPGPLVRIRRRLGERPRLLGLARKLAPREVVAERDADYRRRVQQETLDLLRQRSGTEDPESAEGAKGAKGAEGAKGATRSEGAPSPRRRLRSRPHRRLRSRPRRRPRLHERPSRHPRGLRPIAPPPPPPGS